MSTELPPAGWYPNPDGTGGLRWWSGVGWTEYTRAGDAPPVPEQVQQPETDPAAQTQVLDPGVAPTTAWGEAQAPTTAWGEAQPPATAWGDAQPPATAWGQPAAPATAYDQYSRYTPPAQQPLTPSGMRPLNGLFGDIGRITRRAWFPILGISLLIWTIVSVVWIGSLLSFVNLDALQRAFDLLGSQTSSETGLPTADSEVSAAFRDAFAALSPAGWGALLTAVVVLLVLASMIQTAAVTRIAMDAAAGRPVTWGAGWNSGFTAGFRLLGYYLLIGLLVAAAWLVATVVVVALFALSPALGVAGGLLAILALIAGGVLLTGRLIPVVAQAVVGRHALRWSWTRTRGKFWAVLGRYLLWSLAASVIVNIVVTIISIPISAVVLGTTASATSSDQLGASVLLSLLTIPISMALTAVTLVGIVPIWRDLTDHPEYRAIDENGQPVTVN
jgi:hypothetical protein